MKIIGLEAENFKRLKAVRINPDGTLQVIGGKNAQGKSSVLDAIWAALGGGKAAKETVLPIRDGEEKASVRLDLGDYQITRSWTAKGTTLKVENADGATYSSPQRMLDDLIGQLGFDPLAFTRLPAGKQREELLRLVDLPVDLDALEAEHKALYDARTEIGRQGKSLGDVPPIDDDLPKVEQSASEIIRMIQARKDRNSEIESARKYADDHVTAIKDVTEKIQRLQAELEELRTTQKKALERVKFLGDPQDTDDLEQQLEGIEDANAKIRANNAARELLARKTELRDAYNAKTEEIEAVQRKKADALAQAKFPVSGLGFDENGVTYQGIPLSQASSAEQIRVSVAMGMALNPKLKVLMIKDGSLLDEESMAAIRDQVSEHDFQLWIERVGNADQGAIIIEDGEVA